MSIKPTALHSAVADADAVIGVGAALLGLWASFGAPREDALGLDEVASLLVDTRSDREVRDDLATIRRVLRLEWLGSEVNRHFFVKTILQAELRGLLKPTKWDGATVTVMDDLGNVVGVMGHGMSAEELAEMIAEMRP
jgi:hypothetical protein